MIFNRFKIGGIASFAGWSVMDRGLSLLNVLLINVIVVRHLGAVGMGYLNQALLVFTCASLLLGVFSDAYIINSLNKGEERSNAVGIVFKGRILFGIGLALVALGFFYLNPNFGARGLPWETAILFLTAPWEVLGTVARYEGNGFVLFKSRAVAIVGSAICRVILVYCDASWSVFLIARAIEFLANIIIFRSVFRGALDFKMPSFGRLRAVGNMGIPIVSAGLLNFIFARADQIALAHFYPQSQLGVYGSAVALAENANLLAVIIFPLLKFLNIKEALPAGGTIQSICDILIVLWLGISCFAVLMGLILLPYIWGNSLPGALMIYCLYVPTCIAGAYGTLRDQLNVQFSSSWKVLYTMISSSIVAVIAALILVPLFGLVGAVLSTYVAYVFSIVVGSTFSPVTRNLLGHFVRSFNPQGVYQRRRQWIPLVIKNH